MKKVILTFWGSGEYGLVRLTDAESGVSKVFRVETPGCTHQHSAREALIIGMEAVKVPCEILVRGNLLSWKAHIERPVWQDQKWPNEGWGGNHWGRFLAQKLRHRLTWEKITITEGKI